VSVSGQASVAVSTETYSAFQWPGCLAPLPLFDCHRWQTSTGPAGTDLQEADDQTTTQTLQQLNNFTLYLSISWQSLE